MKLADLRHRRGIRLPACLVLLLLATGCGTGGGAPAEGNASLAARLRVASVAEGAGQHDVVLSVLSSIAATEPDHVEVQTRYAEALIRSGNLAEAGEVLARALRRRPEAPALLLAAGRLRLIAGEAEEALQAFDRALALRPRTVPALNGRGIALDLLQRHAEAQASYEAARAIEPGNLAVVNNLGMSLILARRAGEAVALLGPACRNPQAPERVCQNLAIAQAASARPPSGGEPEQPAASATALAGLAQLLR